MNSSLSNQSLWIQILRQVCNAEALFFPSYLISKMSLLDLQRAALAPFLWRRRVAKNVINDLDATYDQIVREKKVFVSPPRLCTTMVYTWDYLLVPGGRYVVASSGTTLSIYDLGGVGRPNRVSAEPIATADHKITGDWMRKQRGSLVVGQVGERTLRSVVVADDCGQYHK